MFKSFKKAFTLLEMLIVIVIVAILLTIGLGLSRENLEKLKAKAVSEEITGLFDSIFLQVNASNYQQNLSYTGIQLTLSMGVNQIPYAYLGESEALSNQSGTLAGKFLITNIQTDHEEVEELKILYQPFSPTCSLLSPNKEVKTALFSVQAPGRREACFQLNADYCRIQAVDCEKSEAEK